MSRECSCNETGQPCASGARGDHACTTAREVALFLASGTNPTGERCPACNRAVNIVRRADSHVDWKCSCGVYGSSATPRTAAPAARLTTRPAAAPAARPAQRPPVAPAAAAPPPQMDGPAFRGEYSVRGAPELSFDLAPEAMAHGLHAGVAALEHALARAWNLLPEWRRDSLKRQFRAAGGLRITLTRGLTLGGKQASALANVGGAGMSLDLHLAERSHPDEIRRVVLHELAHLAGWRDEAGADAQAAVWLEGRDR